MKTQKSKDKLTEALRNLPGDFGLSTTRQHIVNALKAIQKFEEKHADKKDTNLNLHQQWWDGVTAGTANQPTAGVTKEAMSKSLGYLDFLIDAEKKNLETIQIEKEKEKNQKPGTEVFFN